MPEKALVGTIRKLHYFLNLERYYLHHRPWTIDYWLWTIDQGLKNSKFVNQIILTLTEHVYYQSKRCSQNSGLRAIT